MGDVDRARPSDDPSTWHATQVEPAQARQLRARVVERRRLTLLVYPLSGGYSRRALAPGSLYPVLAELEVLLTPILPVAAFRCLVVLERHSSGTRLGGWKILIDRTIWLADERCVARASP